ncbi:MAG: bifunctional UDP-3-O-[3-hydroxymyristoyl] N-acetylglucosamine deacetylase/3-hydroxyacyl-ACP dehydratase [Gemmatimonadaceae bacterium]|nr:bifunctional UDP-3-O-[3-hydroxymyristoyl] N-acetylglucosamine deacetylase/3-hydroxyacyl-ACP dehydratase [Gemmatimonadaceae bacterium]
MSSVGVLGRQTILGEASLAGIGLHLGLPCTLTFRPAPSGSGIRFARVDLAGTPTIRADVSVAVETERRTQLGEGPEALHTVEHVLAAVAALQIDDILIEMDGPEPPILDGSAGPFFRALEAAGIAPQGGRVEVLSLSAPIRVEHGESWYEAYPADALSLEVAIDFPHPLIGQQRGRYAITPAAFATELADARTFGFAHEVAYLRERGLIKGGTTENALVLGPDGVMANALRWTDEFVRHKAMDCVGDLALAGKRVCARVVAHRPSHAGTVRLVREMTRMARKEKLVIEIEEIMRVLPHRYPFLLVDRVIEMEEGKRVVGIKNVTINEPFFQGHFPGHPIMPGVLIIEAMAQVGGILLMGTVPDPESKVVYFVSLDNVKWRKPVRPGDQLRFELDVVQIRGPLCKMKGVAKVDGTVVAEADMAAMLRDR